MSNINIGRFIDNINKSSKSIEQNLEFIQKMLWLVEAYLDEVPNGRVLFSEFHNLSVFMNLVDMDGKSQFEYILSFVLENLNTDVIQQPDLMVLHMDVETNMKIEKIASAFSISLTPNILSILYDKYLQHEPLNDYEKQIVGLMAHSFQTLNVFRSRMFSLKESYLDKEESYTMSDIEKIMKTLQDMNVEYESCKRIRKSLVQQYKYRVGIKKKERVGEGKQTETEVVKPLFQFTNEKKEKKDKILTSKQYKKLRNELELVLSFNTMQVKRNLTQEERILSASQLLLLGYSDEDVYKFLSNSDSMYQFVLSSKKDSSILENSSLEQLIAIYKSNCKKYEFYSQNGLFDIDEILDMLHICIELSNEEEDSLELEKIKKEFYMNMVTLCSIVSKDYTYELQEIEKEKTKCKII